MNSSVAALNIEYWNTQIPTLHDWLKTLSPTYAATISLESAAFIYHCLRVLFYFRNATSDVIIENLQELLVSDIGPSATLDTDERLSALNALHAHALHNAYCYCFFIAKKDMFREALKDAVKLDYFRNWVNVYTEFQAMLVTTDGKSFVSLLAIMARMVPEEKGDLADYWSETYRKSTRSDCYAHYTTRELAAIESAIRASGKYFQFSPKVVNCCLAVRADGKTPESIFSPRPRNIKQLRKEKRNQERKIQENPFRYVTGPYETSPETNYSLKRLPLKRCNAVAAEDWEVLDVPPKPKKLKIWEPLDLKCDEMLEEESPIMKQETGEDWFTPMDFVDAEDCNPSMNKEELYKLAASIFKCKNEIDANYIRAKYASRMVVRKTLANGKRVFLFVKTEDDKFDTELGKVLAETLNNYSKSTAPPLNKTQVIPLNDSMDE